MSDTTRAYSAAFAASSSCIARRNKSVPPGTSFPAIVRGLGCRARGRKLLPRREQVVALLAAKDRVEELRISRAHTQGGEIAHGLSYLAAGASHHPRFF